MTDRDVSLIGEGKTDDLIKHLRDQAEIFRKEDHRERGAAKLDEAANALEAATARIASLESDASSWQRAAEASASEVTRGRIRIAALEQELRNIVNADTQEWDDRTQFEAWAKSRARHTLGKTK